MAKCYIRVKTEEQLKAVLNWGRWDALIIDSALIKVLDQYFSEAEKQEVYIDLPDVAREARADSILQILKESGRFTGVVIRNLDELGMILELGIRTGVIGDPFLYAFNNDALEQYIELVPEIKFITSDELTDREGSELKYEDRMIRKIYGYQQLMITAQCMSRNYSGCREKRMAFKDDRGNTFYSLSSCDQCYSVIYNGLPTSMLDKDDKTGHFLLDFTIETGEQVTGVLAGDEIRSFTRGHHFKGID